jgi:uncharacterized spore protein YtfJ
MKDILTEAITKKLTATLESIGGAKALYGDPIMFNGEQIVPVAKITVVLSAGAEGSGGGNTGLAGSITGLAKGSGGGAADTTVRVTIEPIGYLRATPNGPVFCPLHQTGS